MTPKQIQGYRNNLKGSVNACTNGATVELDLTTARKLVEVIDVLRTEVARLETIRKNLGDMSMLHLKERNADFARATAAEDEVARLTSAHDTVCGALAETTQFVIAAEADAERLAEAGVIQHEAFGACRNLIEALAAHTQRVNAKEGV